MEYRENPMEIEREETALSYLTGALGALLGALVGTIPLVALALTLKLYSGWAGILVGLAASKGYQLLRGARRHGYAVAVVTIFSILAVLAGILGCEIWVAGGSENVRQAAALLGISPLELVWQAILAEPGSIALSLALPVLVSLLGVTIGNRSLTPYTQRAKYQAAANAARQVAEEQSDIQVFFFQGDIQKQLRRRNLPKVLPGLLALIPLIALMLLRPDALDRVSAASGIGAVLLMLVALILLMIVAFSSLIIDRPAYDGGNFCFVRTEDGLLWRVSLPLLNANAPYQFGTFFGGTVLNLKKAPPEQQALARSAVLRAVRDMRSGQIFPGNPLEKAVIPLRSLTLTRDEPWYWRGFYLDGGNRQRKIKIPKFYEGLTLESAGLPFHKPANPWVVGLLPAAAFLLVSAVLFLPAALQPSQPGALPQREPSQDPSANRSFLDYQVEQASFPVDEQWSELEGGTFADSALGSQYYMVVTPLGSADEAYVLDSLRELWLEDGQVMQDGLYPASRGEAFQTAYTEDGDQYRYFVLEVSYDNGVYACMAGAYSWDKNLLLSVQGYATQASAYPMTASETMRMLKGMAFHVGERDYVTGSSFLAGDGSRMELSPDGGFLWYQSAEDLEGPRYQGTYEVFYGQAAIDQVSSMADYGLSEAELEAVLTANMSGYLPGEGTPLDALYALDPENPDDRQRYHVCKDSFYAVLLHNDILVDADGETSMGYDTLYIGYYIPELGILDLTNANTANHAVWTFQGEG